jgi:uncharacterized sulfatase
MAALRRRGATFDRAFAHGNWTPFSFPALLGADHVFAEDGTIGVGPRPTLAEQLRAAGVSTAGFNAANGFLTPNWGYDRGFDSFETCLDGSPLAGRLLAAHPTLQAWLRVLSTPARRVGARLRGTEVSPVENTAKLHDVEGGATDFLTSVDGPFFCWIHYLDLHTPYAPAPRHVRAVSGDRTGVTRLLRSHVRAGLGREVTDRALESLWTLYRAACRQVDRSVGRLLDSLERVGLRDRTCVILAGDHGEEFQEHGHLAHYPKLYDELVRVPLIVDAPDTPGRAVAPPVGLDGVPPTVADYLGVDADFAGGSLRPTVQAGRRPDRAPVCSVAVRGETVTDQPIPRSRADGELLASARTARYTYIRHTDSGHEQLYDRRVDPGEQHDVSDDRGKVLARLRRAVSRYVSGLGGGTADSGSGEAGSDGADPTVQRRLSALGYG